MTGNGPRGEPDEFDRLVAAWRAEGTVPDWPTCDGEAPAPEPARMPDPAPAPGPLPAIDPADAAVEPVRDDVDEHFVPPEPPPLPRVGPAVAVGLVLLGLGLLLLIAPSVIGVPPGYGLPLGLVAIAAGLTWLLLRLWQSDEEQAGPGDPTNPDDGAIV